jgi:cell division transport system permease protein
VVAVATLAFMLTALSVFILVADGMNRAAAGLEAKANLVADLSDSTSVSQAQNLVQTIEIQWPSTDVSYTSKEQAAAQFRKTFAGNSAMLQAVQGNPLPASLNIRTSDARTLSKIAVALRRNGQVTHLIFNPDLTHKLVEITTFVRIAGIALVAGLALLAIVIVVNTTHLTVQARREEIEVMRLVGADHKFVRNPFIVEGVLLGLAGAVLATLIGIVFYLPIMKEILAGSGSTALALLPINTNAGFLARVAVVVLASGAAVGAAGSYISVRRFAHL